MKKTITLILVAVSIALGCTGLVSASENDSQFSRQQISGAYYYEKDKDSGKPMVGRDN